MHFSKTLSLAILLICLPTTIYANDSTTFVTDSVTNIAPESHAITIAMTGDVMFGTVFPERKLAENEGRNLFKHVDSLLQNANVAVGNLECVLSDSAQPRNKGNGKYSYSFRSPAYGALRLQEAGYDFMGMANNHAFDCSEVGKEHSKANLDSVNIGHAGLIDDEFSIKEIDSLRYGFVAFGHNKVTLKTYDYETVTRIITHLRPQVDLLIVCFHGGAEGTDYTHLPQGEEQYLGENRGNLRKFAHLCIDLGADIVYGHGPHVVRAIELYNDHLIAYSLGNFCTPGGISVVGKKGYAPVLTAQIDSKTGKFIEGRIHSFIQQYGVGPQPDLEHRVAAEMRMLTNADFNNPLINIADDGTITRK